MDIAWPVNHLEIQAEVGKIPIFPRFLDTFGFCIGIRDPHMRKNFKERICEITAHECLHFLRFEKRKPLYPETQRYEYESPNLVWQYAEMVIDPILRAIHFCDLFHFDEEVKLKFRSSYNEFYQMKDGEKGVMDELINLYSQNLSIEEKIKS